MRPALALVPLAYLAFVAGCGGDDPLVASGRLNESPEQNDSAVVELGYGSSDPYNCEPPSGEYVRDCSFSYEQELGVDGRFLLRAPFTDEMESEQERAGAVRFSVHVHYDDEAGTGFCNRTEIVGARFLDGRWVGSDGGELPEIVVDSDSPGECVSWER